MAPLPLRVMFAALELVHHVPTALVPQAIVGDQLSVQEIINVHDPIEPTTALIHDTTSLSPPATFTTPAPPSPTNTVVVSFESLERRQEPDLDDTSSSSTTTKRRSTTKTRSPRPTTTVTVTSSVFSYITSKTSQPGQFLSSSTSDASSSLPDPTPLVATYSSISSFSTVPNIFQDANWSPPELQSRRDNRATIVIGVSVGVIALVLLGLVWVMRVKAAHRRMIKYGVSLPSGAEKPPGWNGKLRNVWRIRRMKKAEDQRLKDEMSTRYGGNGAASSTTLTALNGF